MPAIPGKKPYPGMGRFVIVGAIGGGQAVVMGGANTEEAARKKAARFPGGDTTVIPNAPGSPPAPGTYYGARGDLEPWESA